MTTNRSAVESLLGLDSEVGFDIGATLKDYLRDCRLGICRHHQCWQRHEANVDIESGDPDQPSAGPYFSLEEDEVPLTEDGRIDKHALREMRLFGSASF